MRKGEEGKIDQPKLPEPPLVVRGRGLVKAWMWIGFGVERSPPAKVLGHENGNCQEGKGHNKALDGIRKGDAVEATDALKDKNEQHDDKDGIDCVRFQAENAVEGRFDGNDLGRQIDNGRQYLQKDNRVPEQLGLEPVRDEIGGGLVVPELADLSETKAGSDESPDDGRKGWHPSDGIPTRLESLVGNPHDGVSAVHARKEGSRDDEGAEIPASDVVGRQLVAILSFCLFGLVGCI